MNKNNISYEDFDQAIKVAYKLGIMDGEDSIRNQLQDMRRQLGNMLKTNKEMFRVMSQENQQVKKTDDAIKISPCSAIGILETLKSAGDENRFRALQEKYEVATGKKYNGTKQRTARRAY